MAASNPSLSARRSRRRVRQRVLVGVGLTVATLLAFLLWVGVLGPNIREVRAGQLYRSGQLSGGLLATTIRQRGLRSVINLRGKSKRGFYREEVEVCRQRGGAHFDVSLSAYRLPRPKELQKLLAAFDQAPRPILVHCQQGADRSGLASTIFENVYEGVPLDQAENRQLTWRYGHFGFVGTWRIDRFFDLYRQTGRGQDLRTWIGKSYPEVYKREKIAVQ